IGLALMNYHDVNKRLPPASSLIMGVGELTVDPKTRAGIASGTWVVKILPYIEEKVLADRWDVTKTSNDQGNKDVEAVPLPWLVCRSDSEKLSPDGVDPPGYHNDGGSGVYNPVNNPVMSLWYPVSLGPTNMDGNCPLCPPATAGSPNFCCQ